jgi:hypothetical protein
MGLNDGSKDKADERHPSQNATPFFASLLIEHVLSWFHFRGECRARPGYSP